MPRFSVPVTIVKDFVVDAATAEKAEELVQKACDAQAERHDGAWSLDAPVVNTPMEVIDDYTSYTKDDIEAGE